MADTATIAPPRFGLPEPPPETTVEEYTHRLERAVQAINRADLDFLVVYADREHAADMAYLCGVDPRFEEALLVLRSDGARFLYLGNECQNYGPPPALGIEVGLYQEFSPQGQIRDTPVRPEQLLERCGIGPGSRVGTAGGKYFTAGFVTDVRTAHTLPAFLVDALRAVAGEEHVRNAEEIFLAPDTGLRLTLSAREIVRCEYAAALTSSSVAAALAGIRPGGYEDDVAGLLIDRGLPHSAHTMVNFGEKARRGLSSPSHRRARLGDAYQVAQGLRGALTCRAGAIAHGPRDLGPELAEFFPALVSNYFDTMATWYETLGLGVTTGEVYAAAESVRDPDVFSFALNPGHFLHFEEWSHSTFAPNDPTVLRSGMVLQGDIIPVSAGPFCTVNIEDGVALADERLRAELADDHPETWARIQARRTFLHEEIGVKLDESVLPLSNIPLWHTPYVLDPTRVLTR